MAAVIKVKVSLSENPILGQRTDLVVAVTNSDPTTAASVTGIALCGIPPGFPATIQPPVLATGGAVAVAVSSTLYFPASIVIHGQERDGGASVAAPLLDLYATVSMDDGQVVSSPIKPIVANRPIVETPVDGGLRFDWGGANSYALQMVPATAS